MLAESMARIGMVGESIAEINSRYERVYEEDR